MAGVLALLGSVLAFIVPMALMLFTERWRTFLVAMAGGITILAGMTADFAHGGNAVVGRFLAGLMLVGFAAGSIAKFVMLLGRKPE